jgi:enoyl-CoA hydratase/carnithine racemase
MIRERCVVIEILPDQTTHEQLLNRVRSLARQLAEAKAALAAAETRENVLIDRIREGL